MSGRRTEIGRSHLQVVFAKTRQCPSRINSNDGAFGGSDKRYMHSGDKQGAVSAVDTSKIPQASDIVEENDGVVTTSRPVTAVPECFDSEVLERYWRRPIVKPYDSIS